MSKDVPIGGDQLDPQAKGKGVADMFKGEPTVAWMEFSNSCLSPFNMYMHYFNMDVPHQVPMCELSGR